jgi:hypothetical protein
MHAFTLQQFYEVNAVRALVSVREQPGTNGRVFDLVWHVYADNKARQVLTIVGQGESGPYVDQDLKLSHSQWLGPYGRLLAGLNKIINQTESDTDVMELT